MTILDVGCGDHPWGDVNCDINTGYTAEGGDQKERGMFIDPHKIRNFVKCDAQYLPFKDNAFTKVFCFHVIEHVNNPYLLIRELMRVSHNSVTIRCPHRFSRGAKFPFHVHFFNKSWFAKSLKNFSYHVKVNYEPFPAFFVGFMRVRELVVEVFLEDSFC